MRSCRTITSVQTVLLMASLGLSELGLTKLDVSERKKLVRSDSH
jgi:hypothetical protein